MCSIEKGVNATESESNETAKKESSMSSMKAVQNRNDIERLIEIQNAGDRIQCHIETDSRVTDETVKKCVC